ncbi:response regulator [Paenibacillus sp. OK003]|uniref:response regulator n=1 Tax=Paenibacillus sp. OK003 TaxID=1884380 RepID=UPI0008BFF3D5|nr:response regulator [Paenibacillus sp. OK003]SEK60869.1 two-component system, response regulator YesN [Paenibacillus sp. OK003]
MYDLLIVDDEKSVVDSLALTIPWEEHSIQEVHRAYSAAEALDIASKHAIDIMITDIRMPEMDGLELILEIRKFSHKIRCIILSGHDEFEYAQKAVQYQAANYLLKPIDTDELIHSVTAAIQDIEHEWEEISSFQQIQHALHANLPLLRNQLLNDLLQNKAMSDHILAERLGMLNLPFRSADPFKMMVIRMEEEFSGYDLRSLSLLEYAVSNITEEVFQNPFKLWHCITDQGYLVFLIKNNDRNVLDSVDSYAIRLQNNVQKFLKGAVSICLSKEHTFPESVSELYMASVSAINRNVGENKSYFITLDKKDTESHEQQNLINLHEPPLLPNLLESGNWDEAVSKIARILFLNDARRELSHDQLFMVLLYLSSTFSISFKSQEATVEELLGEEFDVLIRKKSQLSSQRIYIWAEKMIDLRRKKTSHQLKNAHEQITSNVRTYIQEHLAEGISLQMIAEHVGLHPVYLSKVYKTVTGETIGDYLYHLRMKRASYLLLNTDLKIADVSKELGFLAPPHFIKIFKKHYGCTPQEFRTR